MDQSLRENGRLASELEVERRENASLKSRMKELQLLLKASEEERSSVRQENERLVKQTDEYRSQLQDAQVNIATLAGKLEAQESLTSRLEATAQNAKKASGARRRKET